jgi:hypothetical protein
MKQEYKNLWDKFIEEIRKVDADVEDYGDAIAEMQVDLENELDSLNSEEEEEEEDEDDLGEEEEIR